jgi:hypothetical protein
MKDQPVPQAASGMLARRQKFLLEEARLSLRRQFWPR